MKRCYCTLQAYEQSIGPVGHPYPRAKGSGSLSCVHLGCGRALPPRTRVARIEISTPPLDSSRCASAALRRVQAWGLRVLAGNRTPAIQAHIAAAPPAVAEGGAADSLGHDGYRILVCCAPSPSSDVGLYPQTGAFARTGPSGISGKIGASARQRAPMALCGARLYVGRPN